MKQRFDVSRCCCEATTESLYSGYWIQSSTSPGDLGYPLTPSVAGEIREARTYIPPFSYSYTRTHAIILWENVLLSSANTVTSAIISVEAEALNIGFGDLWARVVGYDADNTDDHFGPGPWTIPTEVDAAPRTTAATADFFIRSIPDLSGPYPFTTPDVSSIINEIINRAGWSSGNNLIFFIEETVSTYTAPFTSEILAVDFTALPSITYTAT